MQTWTVRIEGNEDKEPIKNEAAAEKDETKEAATEKVETKVTDKVVEVVKKEKR